MRFGEAIQAFITQRAFGKFDPPTCQKMESFVKVALQNLQEPGYGRFYTANLQWGDPDIEHIEDIIAAAPDVSLQDITVFVKAPPSSASRYRGFAIAKRVGARNLTARLVDTEGKSYLFAATQSGNIRRPLRNQELLLELFEQGLERSQRLRRNSPLPLWKNILPRHDVDL